jgi:hypothetical protein
MISRELQEAIVAEANLAPTVHNTQPTRWSFNERGVMLYIDERRLLDVGDPARQDAGVSCGAALEGTSIALSRHGMGVASVENLWESRDTGPEPALTVAARLSLGEAAIDSLAPFVSQRFTWRGMFDAASDSAIASFAERASAEQNITFATEKSDIDYIADLNDSMSLGVLRDRSYREELVSYMRLSKNHPRWSTDGMNLDALQLSPIEGHLAKLTLRHPIFEGIDAIGLSRMLVSERAKTMSASGVAFFSVSRGTSPLEMGRRFYRCWLNFTRSGFVAWPMAVLADDPQAAKLCMERFDIPGTHQLINVFRLGTVSAERRPLTARLPVNELIVD